MPSSTNISSCQMPVTWQRKPDPHQNGKDPFQEMHQPSDPARADNQRVQHEEYKAQQGSAASRNDSVARRHIHAEPLHQHQLRDEHQCQRKQRRQKAGKTIRA